eukprot:657508-Pleurochrysis_carterae.AAC.1
MTAEKQQARPKRREGAAQRIGVCATAPGASACVLGCECAQVQHVVQRRTRRAVRLAWSRHIHSAARTRTVVRAYKAAGVGCNQLLESWRITTVAACETRGRHSLSLSERA